MEYEINTCVLMKLTVVAFSRLPPLRQGRFLKFALDGLFSFNTVISQPVQLLYHVSDL